jgi:hypothetical protein
MLCAMRSTMPYPTGPPPVLCSLPLTAAAPCCPHAVLT